MAIEKDLLDQLLAGRDPKDVFNKDGLVDELKKALSERILNTEIDEHLDGDGAEGKSNHRNGYSKKSVLTGTSKMTLSVPRDRAQDPRRPGHPYRGRRRPEGLSRGHYRRFPADHRTNMYRPPDPPFDGFCLSLSESKSAHAIRPRWVPVECSSWSLWSESLANPCSVKGTCEFGCNSSRKIEADAEDAARQKRRHGQGTLVGLSRSLLKICISRMDSLPPLR
jgi:Transposase, Mutator family